MNVQDMFLRGEDATCMFPGCTRTTNMQTRAEADHDVILCDPEEAEGVCNHYLQFSDAVEAGDGLRWVAVHIWLAGDQS
jgi:hypothetical protein